jgi:hypothetical protein
MILEIIIASFLTLLLLCGMAWTIYRIGKLVIVTKGSATTNVIISFVWIILMWTLAIL